MTAYYVYALVDREPRLALGPGMVGPSVDVIACGGLLALVEPVAAAPAATTASLRAHDRVVRQASVGVDAILPVRFGTLVNDPAELAVVLRDRHAALAAALRAVRGCVQATVRVYGPGERDAGWDGPDDDTGGLRFEDAASGGGHAGGPGVRYLLGRRRRRRAETRWPALVPLRARLGALVRDERIERREAGPLRGTVHHLIARDAMDQYRRAADSSAAALAPCWLTITGPWAPYAFVPDAWCR